MRSSRRRGRETQLGMRGVAPRAGTLVPMNPWALLWVLLLFVIILAVYETFGVIGALVIVFLIALFFSWP